MQTQEERAQKKKPQTERPQPNSGNEGNSKPTLLTTAPLCPAIIVTE